MEAGIPQTLVRVGRGPVAPSLSALSQSDAEIAEQMIQILFDIDGSYPDRWQVGGDLWTMIKASGAVLLIYEMNNVHIHGTDTRYVILFSLCFIDTTIYFTDSMESTNLSVW